MLFFWLQCIIKKETKTCSNKCLVGSCEFSWFAVAPRDGGSSALFHRDRGTAPCRLKACFNGYLAIVNSYLVVVLSTVWFPDEYSFEL